MVTPRSINVDQEGKWDVCRTVPNVEGKMYLRRLRSVCLILMFNEYFFMGAKHVK
jgi:hypothetical protein